MMPLSMASPGENVTLMAVRGGLQVRKRLADLGLNVGMTIRVEQRNFHGPLIVSVKESRLVLGYGMAQKIMVQPS